MKFRFIFAWYDFWVGLFWDRAKRTLYFFPIPMLGVKVSFYGRRCYVIRKRGWFYRPNERGYTEHLALAGRYTKKEAEVHAYPFAEDPVTAHHISEFQ